MLEISGRVSEPAEKNITRPTVVDECTSFGFEYGTTPYAECKQELAAAKARMQQQQQQYAAQLEIYESERRRQQGLLLMQMGSNIAGGGNGFTPPPKPPAKPVAIGLLPP